VKVGVSGIRVRVGVGMVLVGVGEIVGVAEGVGVGESVGVSEGIGVAVGVGVSVTVGVSVGESVSVGTIVSVRVTVAVGSFGGSGGLNAPHNQSANMISANMINTPRIQMSHFLGAPWYQLDTFRKICLSLQGGCSSGLGCTGGGARASINSPRSPYSASSGSTLSRRA
jgi:hypothetical protein